MLTNTVNMFVSHVCSLKVWGQDMFGGSSPSRFPL